MKHIKGNEQVESKHTHVEYQLLTYSKMKVQQTFEKLP
jgi:hypothetical protein